MINEKIELNVKTDGFGSFKAFLKTYIPDTNEELPTYHKRPAVIVFPGGAYAMRSFREDEPIALQYAAAGFASFVLEYSVASEWYGDVPAHFPQQLCEAALAVKTVRDNSEKWDIDPKKIFVLGFSAGGHLCATAVTMYGCREVLENLGGKPEDYRPDGGILCYPVVSNNCPTHGGSFKNVLGDKYEDESMREYLSCETHIDKNTPPCFIWATSNDEAVPVQNSLLFAKALADNGVKFRIQVYDDGPHGLALCNEYTATEERFFKPEYASWISDSISWIKKQ